MNKFEIAGFSIIGLAFVGFAGYWLIQMFSMFASYL
jgi:ABC-type transporter Mla subunit MlaD